VLTAAAPVPPAAADAAEAVPDKDDAGVTALISDTKNTGAKAAASISTVGLAQTSAPASMDDSGSESVGTFGALMDSGDGAVSGAPATVLASTSATSATIVASGAAAPVGIAASSAGAKVTVKSLAADSRAAVKTTNNARQGTVSAGNDAADEGPAVSSNAVAQQATVQASAAGDVDAVDAPEATSGVRSKTSRSVDSSEAETQTDAAAGGASAAATSSVAAADAAANATDVMVAGHAAASAISAEAATVLAQASTEKHVRAADGLAVASSTSTDGAAEAAQMNASSPSATTAAPDVTPTATLQVHANVESAGFAQGLSEKVSWMVGNGVNSAKLQVNPPQLGPIELSISVTGDHAQVSMVTHSAVTRDALESSSSALKDLLGSQGFGQVSVDISQRSFQERSAYTPPAYERSSSSSASASATAAVAAATTSTRVSTGVLDAYA
jgi:flagellar hook-length control protein FliK